MRQRDPGALHADVQAVGRHRPRQHVYPFDREGIDQRRHILAHERRLHARQEQHDERDQNDCGTGQYEAVAPALEPSTAPGGDAGF